MQSNGGREAADVARYMLPRTAMLHALNFADVAVRAEGDHWVVVDHADRCLLEQRFPDRVAAISLGLLIARQQGGAVWLDRFETSPTPPVSPVTCH